MNKKTEELQKYRNNPAISQSYLKKVLSNDLQPEDDIKKPHFLIGGLVDTLLTTRDCVDDWYYISKVEKYPPPQVKEAFDTFYQYLAVRELPFIWDDSALLQIFRNISDVKTRDELVLEKFEKEKEYWDDLVQADGREVVSKEYWDKCNLVASSLLTNPITSRYFVPDLFSEPKFQCPLYWDYVDVLEGWRENCKGLADILVFDYPNRTIQLVDIKTTSESLATWKRSNGRKYRIDIQMSYYYGGVSKLYPDLKQLNPLIIVENVNYPGKPQIFELTQDDLYVGRYGCQRQKNMIIYDRTNEGEPLNVDWETDNILGWQNAINIYHQSKLLGLKDFDIDYFRTGGVSNLNLWT